MRQKPLGLPAQLLRRARPQHTPWAYGHGGADEAPDQPGESSSGLPPQQKRLQARRAMAPGLQHPPQAKTQKPTGAALQMWTMPPQRARPPCVDASQPTPERSAQALAPEQPRRKAQRLSWAPSCYGWMPGPHRQPCAYDELGAASPRKRMHPRQTQPQRPPPQRRQQPWVYGHDDAAFPRQAFRERCSVLLPIYAQLSSVVRATNLYEDGPSIHSCVVGHPLQLHKP